MKEFRLPSKSRHRTAKAVLWSGSHTTIPASPRCWGGRLLLFFVFLFQSVFGKRMVLFFFRRFGVSLYLPSPVVS